MVPRRSPLFSAVVLAGVSLAQACGDDDIAPAPKPDASTDAASSDASSSDGSPSDALPSDASSSSDACPPDAELPTPPCYLIK